MPRKKITEAPVEESTEKVVTPVVAEAVKEPKEKTTTPKPKDGLAPNPAVAGTRAQPRSGYFFGFGRRKTATARARLYLPEQEVMVKGTKLSRGDVYVNNLPIEKYFSDPFSKSAYTEVFHTTNTAGRFITTVIVAGSGMSGQLGAVTLAIARALCLVDPKFKTILRKKGYMTRDSRAREREKPGLMGARKQKSSPKR